MDVITGFVLFSQDFLSKVPQQQYLLIELGAIIIMAAIFALIARFLKQPPIIAYVLAGFLIGPALFGFVKDISIINSLSEIGIAFLLFLAGLEISVSKLRQVNLKKIFLIGVLQVAIVFGLTLLIRQWAGLDFMQGIYMGIIIAFSSTMVVVKVLADNRELVTMHGRLLLGILLLQDLLAIFAIALLTSKGFSLEIVGFSLLKIGALLLIAFLFEKLIFNKIFRYSATSNNAKELLLLSCLAVLFLFIGLSIFFQLSIVIGAFIAGLSLANLTYKVELESRIGPLRDFFSILFFVALGMQITLTGVAEEWRLFVLLVVGAFVIKNIASFLLIRASGYMERTSFISAVGLSQLSEFSVIIGLLGLSMGVITQSMLSTIIIATILTMSFSVFFMNSESALYKLFLKPIRLFDFIPVSENLGYDDNEKKTILLVGCDRMGSVVLKALEKGNKQEIVVLDYNPEIVESLRKKKISCIYGDIKSPDILEHLEVKNLKKVISTVPDIDDGYVLLDKIKGVNKDVEIILTAHRNSDALKLYASGADYVMLPRFTAGEVVANILNKDKISLEDIKKKQIERVKEAEKVFR